MRRTVSLRTGLLVLTASLATSLVLAELVVRLVAPQQLILVRPDIWQPMDTLGWAHRPNVDTHVNTGERTVRFVTDSRGFRIDPDGPPEASMRILLLGDSYMEALQTEHSESVAGLLERDLPDVLGGPVEVWNTGVSSWDPPHYVLQARQLLGRHAFDLVLVAVYLGNDIVDWRTDAFTPRQPVERWRFRLPRELSRSEWIEAVARPVDDVLKRRSHLFILAKNSFDALLMRQGLSARYVPRELQRSHADSPAWANTADLLEDVRDMADPLGIPTLFVLIPSVYQVEPELLDRHARAVGFDVETLDPEQPNRLLAPHLEARGLEVVDLLPPFRDAMAAGHPPLYGRVDPHFSPDGHQLMWEVIRPLVAERLSGPEGSEGEGESNSGS